MIPVPVGLGVGSPAGLEESELSEPLRSMTLGEGVAAGELKDPVGWLRDGSTLSTPPGVVSDGVGEEGSPERVEDGSAGGVESAPSGGGV